MAQREVGLQEAARALNVTPRNLNRLLDIAGIQTAPDPRDKRRQVLTQEQLQLLLERFPPAPATNGDLDERYALLTQQLNALQAQVVSLTSWVATQSEHIGSLTTRVQDLEQSHEAGTAAHAKSAQAPVKAGARQNMQEAGAASVPAAHRALRSAAKKPRPSAGQSKPASEAVRPPR